jgi:hypothetical protein
MVGSIGDFLKSTNRGKYKYLESKPGERKVDISVYIGLCGDERDVYFVVGVFNTSYCTATVTAVWLKFTLLTTTLQGLLGLRLI